MAAVVSSPDDQAQNDLALEEALHGLVNFQQDPAHLPCERRYKADEGIQSSDSSFRK